MSGRRTLLLGCLLALLAGCGVTTGGPPRTIPPSEVPYDLASPNASTPTATSAPPRQNLPRVYFVDANDVLVPSGRTILGRTVDKRLTDLLEQLAHGPTADERDHGLATALPPGIRLSVAGLDAGTVTVDISGVPDTPTGRSSRRAVGQIVLTATSLPEVRSVLLTHEGVAVEAPLPSGELSSGPLTASDYAATRKAGHS